MVSRRLSRPFWAAPVRALLAVLAALAAAGCDQQFTDPGLIHEDKAQIATVSGNAQSAALGSLLPLPLRVQVRDERGNPAPQQRVDFRLLVGSGFFSAVSGVTDFAGFTQVRFVPTSQGNLAVEASISGGGPGGRTIFSLSAIDSSQVRNPASFRKVSGEPQVGTVGTILPQPLTVQATNADGNPIERLPVVFTATSDGTLLLTARAGDFTTIDSLGNSTPTDSTFGRQIVSFTNENGVAAVLVRLAVRPGPNQVSASVTALEGGNSTTIFNDLTGVLGDVVSASDLQKISGDAQNVIIDTTCVGIPPIPFNPMVVQATDRFRNPVADATVVFRISNGFGVLFDSSGQPCPDGFCLETTDAFGFATARFTSAGSFFGDFAVSAALPAVGTAVLFTGTISIAEAVTGDTIPIVCDIAPAPAARPRAELSRAPAGLPQRPLAGESRVFALPGEVRRKVAF